MLQFRTTKKRWMISAAITLAAAVFVCCNATNFVRDGGFDVFEFVLSLVSVLAAGALCAFKVMMKPRLSMGYALALLAVAPFVSFFIIELADAHDISVFSGAAIWLNLLWYYMLYGFVYLLTNRVRLTVFIAGGLFAVFGVANAFVVLFRGTPIMPTDFFALRTAMSVADNYVFATSGDIIAALSLTALLMVLAAKAVWVNRRRPVKWLVRSGIAVCLVVGVTWFYTFNWVAAYNIYNNLWDQNDTNNKNGSVLGFTMNSKYMLVSPPDGYSADAIELYAKQVESEDPSGQKYRIASPVYGEEANPDDYYLHVGQQPNLVVIMDEALSDLSVLGDFQTNQDYMPFLHSLTENTIKGKLNVSIFGGGTSNTEFEMLTGNTLAFLPTGSNAYQQYVSGPVPSLVSTLKDQGYSAQAIHPYYPEGWNRNAVYEDMGFEHFYSMEDFENPEIIRRYISDKEAFNKIIDLYEQGNQQSPDQPQFLFEVTMQNHSGYSTSYPNFDQQIEVVGDGDYHRTNQYLSLVYETDKAVQQLLDYFSQQSEPTIVLLFGDHQPSLDADFYYDVTGTSVDELSDEDYPNRFKVPFYLWANYDLPEQDLGDISANYLSSLLLQTAGLQMPDYNRYLAQLQKEYPVITAKIVTDKNGVTQKVGLEGIDDESLQMYAQLQYNDLFDTDRRFDKFFTLNGSLNIP